MSVEIAFFAHGTTEDNERGIASGWADSALSYVGNEQAIDLRKLVWCERFDIAFCSDLSRAADSAKLIFGGRIKIVQDRRLRECDYGDLTGEKAARINELMLEHIDKPFPNGESYKDVEKRVRDFLNDLLKSWSGKRVAIIAHRAPQLALEVLANGKSWRQAIEDDWRRRKKWQPFWTYKCKNFRERSGFERIRAR